MKRKLVDISIGISFALAFISQFLGNILFLLGTTIAWILLLYIFYKKVFYKLWKPKFLSITLIIILLSGFLLGKEDLNLYSLKLSTVGLKTGLLMFIRAVLIIAFVNWLLEKLPPQKLKKVFEKIGGEDFGEVISLSFSLIPELQNELESQLKKLKSSSTKFKWYKPKFIKSLLVAILVKTVALAEGLEDKKIQN